MWAVGHLPTVDEVTTQTTYADMVSCRDVRKTYGAGESAVRAVDGVSADFAAGEFTAIMGPSGSGKTTLMHLLAGLDTPTEGAISVAGTSLAGLDDRALTDLRRDRIGFVFQAFNLLPTLTARQNITLPLRLAGRPVDAARLRVITDALQIGDRLEHRPAELSGGQQQRVAVARALLAQPSVVFADEPTGALDIATGRALLGGLRDAAQQYGQTIIMVTHDPGAATYADRVLVMADGRIHDELRRPTRDTILASLASVTV
ncbi:ABC transporter ATP-binding protein [Micromonospora sp. R77]|uniref:ABC transporter ATP-binding protein n=1 Tax=Micromonospora sp. R77 TaxID=2925836 RepID=UPI001F60BF39|nr:ABC transporter ATP-binding protein [Micromonospora sp. R77]MCI4065308.1 ABC transporter ATP-binding protein [Micromonospora sp. R77]